MIAKMAELNQAGKWDDFKCFYADEFRFGCSPCGWIVNDKDSELPHSPNLSSLQPRRAHRVLQAGRCQQRFQRRGLQHRPGQWLCAALWHVLVQARRQRPAEVVASFV